MTSPTATPRSPEWTARMVAVAREHTDAKARGDLEATLATRQPVSPDLGAAID